jgi:hypothetical protein
LGADGLLGLLLLSISRIISHKLTHSTPNSLATFGILGSLDRESGFSKVTTLPPSAFAWAIIQASAPSRNLAIL